jgi:hypothetical protein
MDYPHFEIVFVLTPFKVFQYSGEVSLQTMVVTREKLNL